jgi:hypothetical protein
MLKKFLLVILASATFAATSVAITSSAEARGHRFRMHHHFHTNHRNHDNCHHWKMVPYHGRLVGRWICGTGNF